MNKLQRYKGKDYSLCVDFPVEIIGKDGVIRYYSFEESIDLYQRRIRVARMKSLADPVKTAEIDHCSKRIAQLRRSFYIRYGWEAFIFPNITPETIPHEILGELSAYFRRRLGCGLHTQRAHLELLQADEELITISVNWEKRQFLLYISLGKKGFSQLKSLLHQSQATDHAEIILDMVENEDFNLLLTSIDHNPELPSIENNIQQQSHSFVEAIQAIHNGNLLEALGYFLLAIDENPYQRGAYWGGAILAEQLRAHGENEIILTMAQHYFPKDVGLLLRLCACRIRKKDPSARELLRQIEFIDPTIDINLLYFLDSVQHHKPVLSLKYWNALQRSTHPNLHQTISWLQKMLRKRSLIRQLALFLGALVLLSPIYHVLFLFLPVSLGLFWINEQYFQQKLERALRGQSYIQLSLTPSSDVVQQLTQSFSEDSH